MKKKLKPRFPGLIKKLQRDVIKFGDNRRLARESGVGIQTVERIALGDSKFPWAQTVLAIRQVLDRQNQVEKSVVESAPQTQRSWEVRENRRGQTKKPRFVRPLRRSVERSLKRA